MKQKINLKNENEKYHELEDLTYRDRKSRLM